MHVIRYAIETISHSSYYSLGQVASIAICALVLGAGIVGGAWVLWGRLAVLRMWRSWLAVVDDVN